MVSAQKQFFVRVLTLSPITRSIIESLHTYNTYSYTVRPLLILSAPLASRSGLSYLSADLDYPRFLRPKFSTSNNFRI